LVKGSGKTELLAEAGYKGEKIVLINTGEIPSIGALGAASAAPGRRPATARGRGRQAASALRSTE